MHQRSAPRYRKHLITLILTLGTPAAIGASAEAPTVPFPESFLMGTAVAGFQIDMGCPSLAPELCEDRRSDWYEFITSPWTSDDPLLFMSRQPPTAGPGFFELYRDDLALARHQLGSNALRLSIEWSRIFPTPTFAIEGYEALHQVASAEGLAYYHRLFAEMRRHKLTPLVTIIHYSLPNWIHDAVGCHNDFEHCQRRGWDDPDVIIPEITKYAGFVAHEFGAEVDHWATLNEPFSAAIIPSYLFPSPSRANPPGVFMQVVAAKRATAAMITAHARMYDAIHAADRWSADGSGVNARVGLVAVILAVTPKTPSDADREAANHMGYLFNDLFLNAVCAGQFDEHWDGHAVTRSDLLGRMDYIGVNFYASAKASALPFSLYPEMSPLLNFIPTSYNDRDPASMYQALEDTARFGLPMIVTETGVDHAGDDSRSLDWIKGTLAAVGKAVAAGLPVGGYFYWSLMDNYEWNHGMDQRFGLFAIDRQDPAKRRTPRPAVELFRSYATLRVFPAP